CNLGVDQVLEKTFDEDFHRMSPEEFAQSILVEQLDTRYVAVGASHTFGAGRGAGPERMRQLGVGLGFEVEIVPLISVGGLFVSSTSIRNALAKGDLATARTMLGRPYMVSGTVVRGMGVGADLGAPTANLAVPTDKLLPADGVYAAQAALGDKNTVLPAAIVIGPSPTLAIAETRVEVHLLDFEGDLYGAELTVALWERLRPIVAFGSREELSRQIAADLKRVREMCEKSPE
ncbi:MAG: bifunctional riboflavin kinase/FMN adenylyltransferase, partial [Candidatus Zipacnadales bacterium]